MCQDLLPQSKRLFQNKPWVFQQDGAHAHWANTTQQWYRQMLADFIDKDPWPPSTPELSPIEIWYDIPVESALAACKSFSKRLRLVIKEKGGRINPRALITNRWPPSSKYKHENLILIENVVFITKNETYIYSIAPCKRWLPRYEKYFETNMNHDNHLFYRHSKNRHYLATCLTLIVS